MKAHEFKLYVRCGRRFLNQLINGTASRESAHGIMIESYGRYITDKSSELSSMLKFLAQAADGGVLLHCMVGKDRTGVAVALLLLALQVPRATIMEDYLLSNDYHSTEKIMALIKHHMQLGGVDSISTELVDAMKIYCDANPDYLQAAFDVIDNQFGGTDHYLTEVLGLTDAQLKNLALRFL